MERVDLYLLRELLLSINVFCLSQIRLFSHPPVTCSFSVTREWAILPGWLSQLCVPCPILSTHPMCTPPPLPCPYAPNSLKDSFLGPAPFRLAGLTLALRVASSRQPTFSRDLAHWSDSSLRRPSQKGLAIFLFAPLRCGALHCCDFSARLLSVHVCGRRRGRFPKGVADTRGA